MIVYTPIDIPCKVPDHDMLEQYILENYLINLKETFGYASMLCAVASRNQIKNWRDPLEFFSNDDCGYDLRENPNLYFAPKVQDLFPEFEQILKSLPYQQILGAALSMHTNNLPTHKDEIDTTKPMSPERYNVLLSPHYGQASFYITKDQNSKKDYPIILKDYPIYAFNNMDTYHGADIILDRRIILICSGIIDNKKHKELIERSANKFKDYVIRYEV